MSQTFTSESLPNRFDHAEAQSRIYAWWEEKGCFEAQPDADGKPFTIVIPPPNVTGALHLGHALNNTLQDILIRMKRMQGFNTLWMPGTDHAGIATQAVVEKRLREEQGLTRHDLGREKLVERIWEWKDQYEARILSQLKRMGCSCDWPRTRFTLDPICARAVRTTFFDLFKKGLIYHGKKLVNWDPFLQTAVSDDEVFHKEVKGHFWHFRYPVIDPKPGEPTHVTIATTRPETMLGDTAVAVHPNPAAALDRLDAKLLDKMATASAKEKDDIQSSLDNVRQRRETMLPQLDQLRDMANDGRMLLLPLMEREIPLVADEWAKPEMGSGCVKITPAHDPNDYEVGLRQDLPMINILKPDGTLNRNAGKYRDMTVMEAREQVVADLEAQGLLGEVEDRLIDLAHSDRGKTPIEPYLADQWFVRMGQLAQSAMDAVKDDRVKIVPPRYAKGYLDWLDEKRDWPVSRQLWWGHQIPIWSKPCKDEAEHDQFLDELKKDPDIAAAKLPYQVEINTDFDPEDEDSAYARLHVCINEGTAEAEARFEQLGYAREEDVLDTWFSSALWPHSTLGWPEKTPELGCYYPTSTLITSRDIITLWVARMVLSGLNNVGEIPFHEVFVHPKILDGDGETMSKSKGNGIDPLDVIDKFGADALRFAMAFLTGDVQDVRMPVQFECPYDAPSKEKSPKEKSKEDEADDKCGGLVKQTKKNRILPKIKCPKCKREFSTQWATAEADLALPRGPVVSERFEVARNFGNKLWNASRFALMNLNGFTPGAVADDALSVEDRWILSRLATVTAQVTEALDAYRYSDATRTLYDFAWDEFCSFFVEMLKNRLSDDATRVVAQRVLAHTLDTLLRLLHPIIPFITEEVWQLLGKAAPERGLEPQMASETIMKAPWPEAAASRQDEEIETRFAEFQAVLGALREIRSRQNIPPKSPIEFSVRCNEATVKLLQPMEPYFASMANATAVAWGEQTEPPATNATVHISGADVFVDLTGFIDVDAEKARLEKREREVLGQIQGKEKKLANTKFVERAPADVVQRERDSLAELKVELTSVQTTLVGLRGGSQQ